MRRAAHLVLAALAASACTKILGIDGRYVLEQEQGDTGGIHGLGAGGLEEAGPESGGLGGDTGGLTGAGGLIAAGGVRMGAGGALVGAGGTGGRAEGSGGAETGGSGNATAADALAPCGAGKKRCGGVCVTPDPSVGCGATGCDQCPSAPPVNGYLVCVNDQCDYACLQDFTKNQSKSSCDPVMSGSGGASAGGAGGTGGSTGRIGSPCTVTLGPPQPSSQCSSCGPFPGCCDPVTARCGCLYVAACI